MTTIDPGSDCYHVLRIMTNYLPTNRKKITRLERAETDLYRSMDRGDPADKIERCAERVRSSCYLGTKLRLVFEATQGDPESL